MTRPFTFAPAGPRCEPRSEACGVWDGASRRRLLLLLLLLLLAEHLVARVLHRELTSLDGGGARLTVTRPLVSRESTRR